ncbi:MAG: alanine racemase [Pseudomonadota bacterium]
MRRRELLKHASLTATIPSLLWSPGTGATSPNAPSSQTGGHNPYYAKLNQLLKTQGPGRPVMLIDKQRMNHNIDAITRSVGNKKTYRAVVKSLPSVPLLQHVTLRSKSQALMVFHQPFLNEVAKSFPDSDVLLGKPMPVQAVQTFYDKLDTNRYNASLKVQWLIDSLARLEQYLGLAQDLGVSMRVNFEINVGLYRGGLESPEALSKALSIIDQHPNHLRLSGLMGYEPHLTGMQADLRHPAVQSVLSVYDGYIDQIKQNQIDPTTLTLNGAGSHTLKIYEYDHRMNDLSAGSGVVMPTDFDTHHLNDHQPAVFIATPILKRYPKNPVMPAPPQNMDQVYYIYGGYWKAKVVSPQEVGETIYQSTNQSPIATSANVDLEVDDYMFLRPTQSEFVMLQFGDLLVVDQGEITQTWPVFHQTG